MSDEMDYGESYGENGNGGSPEIAITQIYVQPVVAQSTEPVILGVEAQNTGSAETGPFRARYSIDNGESQEFSFPSLNPGQTHYEDWEHAPLQAGSYTFSALLDADSQVQETNRDDNRASMSFLVEEAAIPLDGNGHEGASDGAEELALASSDGGVMEGIGVALAAASFAKELLPAGSGGFSLTNVQFRYSREESGPLDPTETTHTVLQIDSIKGFGASFAFLELVLRYDGNNILSAYTRQGTVSGYDGGATGSEANVSFGAVEVSSPHDEVTQAYLTFEGFNNPSGLGWQRFNGRILVSGDGRVTPQECRLTDGDGNTKTDPWCYVGWD